MTVSVIISAYNGEIYIRECLDSILCQTMTDYEIIVVDDMSDDKTEEIVAEYVKKHNNIRLYINKRHNHSLALNIGLDAAKGRYIARIDQDDVMMPCRLATQTDFMDKNSDIDVCGSWYKTFGCVSEECKGMSGEIHDALLLMLLGNPIANPTSMIRKSFIDKNSIRYDENFRYAEDFRFWSEVAKAGGKFHILPEILQKYRVHEKQATLMHGIEQDDEALCVRCDILDFIIKSKMIPDMTMGTIVRLLEIYNGKNLIEPATIFNLAYEILSNYNIVKQRNININCENFSSNTQSNIMKF